MLPDTFMGRTACCFTGHRPDGLPAGGDELHPDMLLLKQRLLSAVGEAAGLGIGTFLAGGAEGFDTLAAEAVLAWRRFYPELALTLALPSRTQSLRWSDGARARYERILAGANSIFYASDDRNGYASMRCRNRYLADHADCCIAYLARAAGGTLYTVNYAMDRGLPVYNLFTDRPVE